MNAIFTAASIIFQPLLFLYMILGVAAGLIAGALPGISATMAMALFTPLTFSMDRSTAFAVLCAIYVGAISGGQFSAILLKIPGTNASIATTFDGFPLARKGKASQAIGIALVASFIGSCMGFVFMTTCSSLLANFALKFGPAEYFAVSFLGLSTIASLLGKSVIRGVISALFGLILSTIGIDAISGVERYTFNIVQLTGGVALIPVLLGIFAVPQVLQDLLEKQDYVIQSDTRLKTMIPKFSELIKHWKNFLRSSLIGTWIGILPGAGSTTAALIAYDQAKKASEIPESFGTGNIEGIIASETANNAVIGGAFIPTLTLGIPGDSPLAVMLAALTIHGLQAGPLLFKTNPEDISLIMLSLWISSLIMIILGLFGAKLIIRTLKIPKHILIPIIICLCCVGSYALNQNWFDVFVMIGLGLVGYLMGKMGFPTGPVALGLILGPLVEVNFRRAIQISNTGILGVINRPITSIVLLITLFNIIYPFIRGKIKPTLMKFVTRMIKNNSHSSRSKLYPEQKVRFHKATTTRNVISRKTIAVAIGLCVFAVGYFILSDNLPIISSHGGTSLAYSAEFFPKILAVLLFIMGISILLTDQFISTEDSTYKFKGNRPALLQLLLIILYPFAMLNLGFVVSSILFVYLSIRFSLKTHGHIKILVIAIVTTSAIFLLIEKVFMVILPHGFIY